MRRSLGHPLFPIAALALACGIEEPTAPTRSVPSMETPASVVLTSIAVIDVPGDVGTYASLASGADGRQHITYRDATNADLKYATCASSCGSAANWIRGVVDAVGDVGRASSLEVGPDGRKHVTYRDEGNGDLKYATCAPAASCSLISSWKKVRVDANNDAGLGSALALGPDGTRHVSYLRRQGPLGETMALRYASCTSSCGQAASWSKMTIRESANANGVSASFLSTSIAIGPDGRRHITYSDAGGSDLRYATCPSNCGLPASWRSIQIDSSSQRIGYHSSLALGPDGVLHLSYYDLANSDLLYARCAFSCWLPTSWKTVRVDASTLGVGSYSSLAVETDGRLHISALQYPDGELYYATCSAGCTAPTSWTRAVLDGATTRVGWYTSLTARNGVVRIAYADGGNQDLKFLTRTPLADPF
jgi:hypothetical protein